MSQGEAQEGAVSTRLKRMYWRCSNSHFRLIVSLVLIQIATCVGHLLSLYDLYDATDLTTLPWVFYFLSNLMKQCTDRNQLMALTLVGFSFVFRVTFQRLLRYSISPPSLGCTHITELGKLVPWKAFWAALYWETNSPRSLIVGYYSYIKYLHPTASTKSTWTLTHCTWHAWSLPSMLHMPGHVLTQPQWQTMITHWSVAPHWCYWRMTPRQTQRAQWTGTQPCSGE